MKQFMILAVAGLMALAGGACRGPMTTETGADWDGTASDHAFIGFHIEFSPGITDAFEIEPGDTHLVAASKHHSACVMRSSAPYCDPLDVDKVWYQGEDGDVDITEWWGGGEYDYHLSTGEPRTLKCGLTVTKVEQ